MAHVQSFPPVADANGRVLILGSMPGTASLAAGQYYAHPRNAFWPIMQAVYGIPATLGYASRCRALVAHGVAVWDVLQTCYREGSLDAAIDPTTIVANDFAAFFDDHPNVAAIRFNGAMAETAYRRHVLPTLGAEKSAIERARLPSTSPANAGYSFERKLAAWRCMLP